MARRLQNCFMNRPGFVGIAAVVTLASVLSCATNTGSPPRLVAGKDERIAFDSRRDGNFEIYVMNADGTDQRRLTHTPGGKESWLPAWSPDRRRISFSSNRDGNWQLYVMNTDGSNVARLTNTAGKYNWNTDWSPDGKRIAVDSDRDGGWELFVMDPDGSNVRRLTHFLDNHQGPGNPDWSPDGNKITFAVCADPGCNDDQIEIYVMNADGSDQRQLTRTPSRGSWTPRWSPDGRTIVFASDRGRVSGADSEIYLMDADGSNVRRLNVEGGRPHWSPDGKSIVFMSDRDCALQQKGKWNMNCNEIYVMRADGSGLRRLTRNDTHDGHPAW